MPGAMPIFLFLQILIGQKRTIATSILFSAFGVFGQAKLF
jgi:hypothetical protein